MVKTWFKLKIKTPGAYLALLIEPYNDSSEYTEYISFENWELYTFKIRPDITTPQLHNESIVDVYYYEATERKLLGNTTFTHSLIADRASFIDGPNDGPKTECTCKSWTLLHFGCKCGFLK